MIIKYVEEHPDAYLKEIAEGLSFIFGVETAEKTQVREKIPLLHKQIEAYLEKIKGIPKEKLVYIR